MPITTEATSFSRDALGRYVCNAFSEAVLSADPNPRADLGRPYSDSNARPFDFIVIGGGTFGAALAQHLFFNDVSGTHRILVLEGGPFLVPEHVQNLPMIGLGTPDPTSVADLAALPVADRQRWSKEVWGLAWHSNVKFPGLAYCVGGRSLYWGGWSPQPLDREMNGAANGWPSAVAADLQDRYFREASEQIGVLQTNDFIYGPLHSALRSRLLSGIGQVTCALPLAALPDHPGVRWSAAPPSDAQLMSLLGLPTGPIPPRADLLNMMKLEAPLAVQSQTEAGQFPINKFSSVPPLIRAVRAAWTESGGSDTAKRLMVVPYCHVSQLDWAGPGSPVTAVETNLGRIPLAKGGAVIVALGTIESTRLALNSFHGVPNEGLIGQSLIAHLRSNLAMRIPRSSLPNAAALPNALSASALFVKGAAPNGGTFHLQITASGVGANGGDSEAELWQKIPDIDGLEQLRAADDASVVITIRAIGEMEPRNPQSSVQLDPNLDSDFGTPRAFVRLAPSVADGAVWDAMDRASDDVASVFSNGQPFEVQKADGSFVRVQPGDNLRALVPYTAKADKNNPGRRDGLGTTHHEAGTLRMGTSPAASVTDTDGRFHNVVNAYALGPALLPRMGSPNPMLTGIALARRLGDRLIPPPPQRALEAGFTSLFDGTDFTLSHWRFAGGGSFSRSGRALVARPGGEIGLLYFPQIFADFTLRLDFMLPRPSGPNNDNSGVFVRFRDPTQPVPDRTNPQITYPYVNQAFVAVDTGFEIQIDDEARGDTRINEADGFPYNRTGAIYKIKGLGMAPGQQNYTNMQHLQPGAWSALEIRVAGDRYEVDLNGQPSTRFTNVDGFRGRPGFIGLQVHTGRVAFANVRIQ